MKRPIGFGFFGGISPLLSLKEPALDIYEKDNKVIVKAELPGLNKKDIQIKLDGNILTIAGKKQLEREVKKVDYYYMERRQGNILRSIVIPDGIKQDSIKASYKDGILTIELQREPKDTPKGKDIQID